MPRSGERRGTAFCFTRAQTIVKQTVIKREEGKTMNTLLFPTVTMSAATFLLSIIIKPLQSKYSHSSNFGRDYTVVTDKLSAPKTTRLPVVLYLAGTSTDKSFTPLLTYLTPWTSLASARITLRPRLGMTLQMSLSWRTLSRFLVDQKALSNILALYKGNMASSQVSSWTKTALLLERIVVRSRGMYLSPIPSEQLD